MTTDNLIRAENYERDIMSNVRDIMTSEGLTIQGLANQIGVHHNTLSGWLTGKRRPRLGALPNLAYALEMSIGRLINEE